MSSVRVLSQPVVEHVPKRFLAVIGVALQYNDADTNFPPPKLRATLCQLAATSVTTCSSTSLMSGVDETCRRARAPEGVVLESVSGLPFFLPSVRQPSLYSSGWLGTEGDCDEMWRACSPEGVVLESVSGLPSFLLSVRRPSLYSSGWLGTVSDCDEAWRACSPERVV